MSNDFTSALTTFVMKELNGDQKSPLDRQYELFDNVVNSALAKSHSAFAIHAMGIDSDGNPVKANRCKKCLHAEEGNSTLRPCTIGLQADALDARLNKTKPIFPRL